MATGGSDEATLSLAGGMTQSERKLHRVVAHVVGIDKLRFEAVVAAGVVVQVLEAFPLPIILSDCELEDSIGLTRAVDLE